MSEIDKIRAAHDGVAALKLRWRCMDGRQAIEALSLFTSAEIRPLFDASRLLEKWADRVDDPKPVRAVARTVDAIVDRCKGPDGKVAAVGMVHVIAEELRAITMACRYLMEYIGMVQAAANNRRSRDSGKS